MKSSEPPLISLVLVSYNQRQFLQEAIQSVIDQDYPNIELIIMDGGSTDGSVEIIQSFASQAAYINIGPDGGAPSALNAGFARATGSLYAYLNSDDVLLPQAASCWVKAFAETQADVVYGDIRIVDEVGRPSHLPNKRVSEFKATPFNLRRMAAGGCTIPQQSSAWRKEVHEKIGGFVEENRSSWDGEFFNDAAIAGCSFVLIPEVLALFRVHGQSISGTGKHAAHRRIDHERMHRKWVAGGFRISPFEKVFWIRIGQAMRAWRYITERSK
jgi:glycosyltransferase involved in cell wall biosynthesis